MKVGGFWKFEKFDVLKVFKVRRILSKTSREIARSIDKRSIIPSDLSDTSNTIYIYYINKKNSLRDGEESKSPSEIVPQTFAIISSRVGWYRLPLRLVGEYRLNRTEWIVFKYLQSEGSSKFFSQKLSSRRHSVQGYSFNVWSFWNFCELNSWFSSFRNFFEKRIGSFRFLNSSKQFVSNEYIKIILQKIGKITFITWSFRNFFEKRIGSFRFLNSYLDNFARVILE